MNGKSWRCGIGHTSATAKYGSRILAAGRLIRSRSAGDAYPDRLQIRIRTDDLADGSTESGLEWPALPYPLDCFTRGFFQVARYANGQVHFVEQHIRAHGSSS